MKEIQRIAGFLAINRFLQMCIVSGIRKDFEQAPTLDAFCSVGPMIVQSSIIHADFLDWKAEQMYQLAQDQTFPCMQFAGKFIFIASHWLIA